ncbi:hypothetical protein AUJ84_00650 [Candidatus Pacearchaeota archaeon CG1_02_32_132]|nr:MAG: hypothetical protein AUJ84_00650 [Candidatus Pacearchaeota archaeon CG1_02_32_132]
MDLYFALMYILAYIGLIATSFYVINIFLYYKNIPKPEPKTDKSVSIIIPAYNERKGIARTIKSALSLDYPSENLEIIVVDDGSKDNTYKLAKKFESISSRVRVFSKPNGGKGSALNFGILRAKGDIIVTMDADTFVKKDALKIMVGYFYDEKVTSVSPSMGVYKPNGIWGRIVQIEYYMGVFLRKSFATVNAIHITPGAFSAYRQSFFLEHGGFDERNLTEDLEVALRIQSKNGVIENAEDAVAYTFSPESFRSLLYQRRRWYAGLVKNLWNYRKLFGFKHGPLGYLVLPVAVITVILSVVLTIYTFTRVLLQLADDIIFLKSINFDFGGWIGFNTYLIQRFFYTLFSRPVFILAVLFLAMLAVYIHFSRKKMGYKEGVKINFVLFSLFYSLLFAFWWIVSFIYISLNRKVSWREGLG